MAANPIPNINGNGNIEPGGSCGEPSDFRIREYPYGRPTTTPTKYTPTEVAQGLKKVLSEEDSSAEVHSRGQDGFQTASIIFNGAVKTSALVLVKPRSAKDVSTIIKFCKSHKLEVSVKAGGTGVHGWSVAGHVIIDLTLLNEITISLPDEATSLQKSFEALSLNNRNRNGNVNGNGSPEIPNGEIPKRPSLAESQQSSSGLGTGTKRAASDYLDENDNDGSAAEGRSKRRAELEGITEVDNEHQGLPMPTGTSNDVEMEKSTSGSSGSRSGSGSSSNPSRGSSISTPNSSVPSGSKILNEDPPVSSSSSSSLPQPRVTYVNPSPTTTSTLPSLPTVSNTFPGGSSFGSTSSNLILNTNPDPPPYVLVAFGAGVHSKTLDSATASSPYGAFHIPTSAFPVGAGQFVLGGFGFIGRKHGLAMDNLVEAEMVLADGRIVWVGENGKCGGDWKDDEDPEEVWWGIRGAGPALGVVTRFRAKAYYLPSVYAGNFIYVFDRSTTPSLLRHVRDCVKGSSRDLYTNIIMTAGPPNAPAIVVIQLCFSGKRSEGEAYVQAISSWDGGRCLFQDFSERTYQRQQVAVEEILKDGKGRKWYIKSDMLSSMNEEVIEQTCARFSSVPDGCTWLFEYTGGGVAGEIKDSCFPQTHRNSQFTVAALHQWGHNETPSADTKCVMTAERWIDEVIHPHSPGGPLPCFLQSSYEHEVAGVYGENYLRLKALKEIIDPHNMFRHAPWAPRSSPYEDGHAMMNDSEPAPGAEAHHEELMRPEDAKTLEGKLLMTLHGGGVQAEDMEKAVEELLKKSQE